MIYDVLDICRYVINYSNDKNYNISNLKLQKLLYFIQAYFLLKNKDKPCFSDKIEAWNFGPVVSVAYHEYKQYGSGNIPPIDSYIVLSMDGDFLRFKKIKYDENVIDKQDRELINNVVDGLSGYSATDLVAITHNQDPWLNVYTPSSNKEITKESIEEYFNDK